MGKARPILCLLSLLFTITSPTLNLEAGDWAELEVTVEEKKPEAIGEVDTRPLVEYQVLEMTQDDIDEEIKMGEMELIAQLVQAEAGNQDLMGKRLVVAVVLNRVDSEIFPNSVAEVIFQENQFSVIKNGMFDAAGWFIDETTYEAVALEYESRTNYDILYFSREKSKYATNHFKYQDHWFGW